MSYRHHCIICGRFAEWGADSSTPFGNSYDVEPPDPEYFCSRCARTEKERAIKIGWLPTNWIPARWEHEAAKTLKYWRAGPKAAAWGNWFSLNKPLPDGYEWHTKLEEITT